MVAGNYCQVVPLYAYANRTIEVILSSVFFTIKFVRNILLCTIVWKTYVYVHA
ncbi:hypothetical protein ACE6H2_001948 [Prunus campanulata]